MIFYRGGPPTNIPKGATVRDIYNYETFELNNRIGAAPEFFDLTAKGCQWLCRKEADAAEYGSVSRVEMHCYLILLTDSNGGYFVKEQ